MDFKQIEAFVNVVRYKSFSRAADATFFTQPTISTHISTLEKELDTKLLDRKGRTVEMTPQGRKFYKYAVEMVNTRAQAVDALDLGSDGVEGVLEIQTSTIPGVAFLPTLLSGFHAEHERAQFYVEMSDSKMVVENLFDRRGEIGFIGERGGEPNLEYTPLFSDRVVLVVPASMAREEEVVSLENVVNIPLIWREDGSATRKSFEEKLAARGYDRNMLNFVARINDLTTILRSVEAGLGAAIMSAHTVEKYGGNGLRAYPIEGFEEQREFYMISQKGVFLSPVAEAFKRYVIEHAGSVFE